MTCIVGLVKGDTVWLGADSAGTDGALNRTIIKDPKVFRRDDIGFGVCGSPKVMDALAHSIHLPFQVGGINDRDFLVSELVPAIRKGLVDLDAAGENKNPFGGGSGVRFEGEMLLGYRGKLYKLQGNFQLIQSADGFDSTGSGGQLALGSLRATRNISNPRKRLLTALDASTANAACAPPFVIITVESKRRPWN
jgi:ATP-dependent protease HslVU (ClpYQ) peptidase subunit